jgi:hypothetical protein
VYDRAQRDDLIQASIIMASFLYNAATRDDLLPRKPLSVEVKYEPSAASASTRKDAKKN